MTKLTRSAARLFVVSTLTVACVQLWALAVNAAEPNRPSAARAKLAKEQAPMACVVRYTFNANGTIHRISRCEAVSR